MSETGTVILVSREGETFDVPIKIAKMSQLVADTFDEDEDSDDEDDIKTIPLPNVRSDILRKIVEFGTYYQETEAMTAIQTPLNSSRLEDLVQEYYVEFVNVENKMLFDLVAAANFMDIKPLLDLTCLAVSIMIKGKSPEELKEMFKIKGASSAEEDKQVLEENDFIQQSTET
ncbi:phase kinase-associated protein 1 [Seminavis robusta]|uniref:Phase kinase-associated protein 1 n=1 Tax=Seminavis robusta TaxID=568900 RepID=A0A9N8E699_9STRA|nr:phase kinase-associated protein 1 [Seminavis robusta]|eukprot:Sro696_g188910.1 phase kinase-associated protein 1 (173) ;mRNA; f:28827-29548